MQSSEKGHMRVHLHKDPSHFDSDSLHLDQVPEFGKAVFKNCVFYNNSASGGECLLFFVFFFLTDLALLLNAKKKREKTFSTTFRKRLTCH